MNQPINKGETGHVAMINAVESAVKGPATAGAVNTETARGCGRYQGATK